MTDSVSRPSNARRDLALLLIAFAVVAAIRITAPSDLATGDQPYQADYIRDIVHNGAWAAQHLADGTAATKPPLYNWLAAAGVIATGSESDFMLKLPSLLAGLLTLLLMWDLARDAAGPDAALFAGLFLVCSTMYSKQIYFARTDMLLTALIVVQVWAAMRRGGPLLFWIAAALAMLTKGPIGVVIPLLALSIWWWQRGELRQRWREMHLPWGLLFVFAVFGAWFLVAIRYEPAVFDQLVYAETIDRFKASSSKSKENRHVLYYVPHFLGRMAPASLFAAVGAVTILRARLHRERAGVYLWWFLATFVLLSLVPSKRADRLFPLFPAVCVVAGWAAARPAIRTIRVAGAVLALIGAAAAVSPLFMDTGLVFVLAGVAIGLCAVAALRFEARRAVLAISLAMVTVVAAYQHSKPASNSLPKNYLKPTRP